MPRKMPKADDMKTAGKFDPKKFADSIPAARDAMASGETRIHKVVIDTDKDGKPRIAIFRSHSHNSNGLDPKLALRLQEVLAAVIAEGLITVGDVTEGAEPDKDILNITAA